MLFVGQKYMNLLEKNRELKSSQDSLVKNYESMDKAFTAVCKEQNVLREERDRLQTRVDELEAELGKQQKSPATGEATNHLPHICSQCYKILGEKQTTDEMRTEESLLQERARFIRFARWHIEFSF